MSLGELFGIARECKGWTLRELEKKTGISNARDRQGQEPELYDSSCSRRRSRHQTRPRRDRHQGAA